MPPWLRGLSLSLVGLTACAWLYAYAQGAFDPTTTIPVFENGFRLGPERLNGMNRTGATALTVGGTDVATLSTLAGTSAVVTTAAGEIVTMPATQVIASGGTIAADACGGLKRISSASAVTTDTTNTFTAPAAGNAGCLMLVCNMNASDAITLDVNALTKLVGGANVALAASACLAVGQDGTTWRQLTAQLAAT